MAKRPNPETSDVSVRQRGRNFIEGMSAGEAIVGSVVAANASRKGVGYFERNIPAVPSTGLGYPSAPAYTPNPTLGRVIGAPNAWNYTANLSGWNPTSRLGQVGKFGVGAGTAFATSLATDAAVDWVTKTGNTERVNALTKKLKEQGVDITKEEVSSILMQYADPMAAEKVLGVDYNTYAGGVKTAAQITGAVGGGAATSAGLGSYFQGLRNWIESGAYDERDNMVESIIKQRRDTNSRMRKNVAQLGPAMTEGLYGKQYRKDMEMPTLGQVGFAAPRPDTESMSPEELNARNNYLSIPVHERIWRKDAPLVGGEQFYKDVAEAFPSENQVIDETDPNAPKIAGPAIQVPEQLRRQQIDEVMNYHNLAPDVRRQVVGGKEADLIYSGRPSFTDSNGQGAQPPPQQKLPSGGGPREVTSTSTLPNPRLSPPTTPQEAERNIIAGGVSRGLSPQAAIMENYINKSGRKTAEQRDAEIAAALQDPNSAFSQAARRNYAGSLANNPHAQVPEDQLNGRDQGVANAMRLLKAGLINTDEMPMMAEPRWAGDNEYRLADAEYQGFSDSRQRKTMADIDTAYGAVQGAKDMYGRASDYVRSMLTPKQGPMQPKPLPFKWEKEYMDMFTKGMRSLPVPVTAPNGPTFTQTTRDAFPQPNYMPNSVLNLPSYNSNPRINPNSDFDGYERPAPSSFPGIPNVPVRPQFNDGPEYAGGVTGTFPGVPKMNPKQGRPKFK